VRLDEEKKFNRLRGSKSSVGITSCFVERDISENSSVHVIYCNSASKHKTIYEYEIMLNDICRSTEQFIGYLKRRSDAHTRQTANSHERLQNIRFDRVLKLHGQSARG